MDFLSRGPGGPSPGACFFPPAKGEPEFEKGVLPANRIAATHPSSRHAIGRTDTQLQTEAMRCRPKATTTEQCAVGPRREVPSNALSVKH